MPELPEVETVRRGLERIAPAGTVIRRVEVRRRDLRSPIPRPLARLARGQPILAYERWGKYLLWRLKTHVLINHLGMTGRWCDTTGREPETHDHVMLHLDNGRRLAYNDARRFGLLDLAAEGRERAHPRLESLGPDALDQDGFQISHLAQALRSRRAAVKALLLDQRVVAGVGNIYACEALFRAGIRPTLAAGRISRRRLERLIETVRQVLGEAIESGGSTLKDFRDAGGERGFFQHRFQVYGRASEPCHQCGKKLKGAYVAGRSTVWCTGCQR